MIVAAASRLVRVVVVIAVVTMFTFALFNLLPGDPALTVLGDTATPEQVAQVRAELHLDDPLPQRYADWVGGIVQGDFGESLRTRTPVLETILSRLPISLEIMLAAQVLALAIAIPLALATAYKEGGRLDRLVTGATVSMISVPNFVVAFVLVLVFALTLGWFPATGFTRLSDGVADNLRSLVLPAVTLAVTEIAVYQRTLRVELLATLREDFVLLARAKGLPARRVLLRHALRPSSLPLLTLAGLNVARLIGGAVIVEVIFAIPGLGSLMLEAITGRDVITVQGIVVFVAAGFVVVNAVVDALYRVLDPRLRVAR